MVDVQVKAIAASSPIAPRSTLLELIGIIPIPEAGGSIASKESRLSNIVGSRTFLVVTFMVALHHILGPSLACVMRPIVSAKKLVIRFGLSVTRIPLQIS